MDTQTNSVDGNRYDQVFSNGTFFDEIYTMDRKSYTWIALKKLITGIRAYEQITIEGYK